MTSSRIFIKGLPPKISEDEFRKHFSQKHAITDAKLLPHRRIGYIGYKTPEDAVKAVDYFNKSFIRMSRIGVEIARPIFDSTLPTPRRLQHERDIERGKAQLNGQSTTVSTTTDYGKKRKRSDVDEADPKLKEFLDVMQSGSRPKKLVEDDDDSLVEPPSKMQALEMPEGESDGDYEVVPKKSKSTKIKPAQPPKPEAVESVITVPGETAQGGSILVGQDATDDDWLRGRTNRLLDLVDPTDIAAKPQDIMDPIVQDDKESSEPDEKPTQSDNVEAESFEEEPDPAIQQIQETGRLFIRNLPYSASESDLTGHFQAHGSLEEVHVSIDSNGTSKGFALVQYLDPASAIEAYQILDQKPFQGRLLHILPAAAKRKSKLDEFAISKLPLKKQKQIKKKLEASSTSFNWNSLYMNQDAVNTSVASRLGVSKADLLDPTSANAAVKQAISETTIIQETKSYFAKNGVDLNAFKHRERGDTAILVKNFPFGMSLEELRKMFEEFGQVVEVLMPPSGTIAIVEFSHPTQARAAFSSLAYRRIKDSVLFLEKAPRDLFTGVEANETVTPSDQNLSKSDLLEGETEVESSTLFVRNLNFATASQRLASIFKPLEGFMSARVNTKKDPKTPGKVLSMGFGFLEFSSKAQAQAALKAMDGYNLDGHKLLIRASHKGHDAAEERRKEDRAKKLAGRRTKIIIKNLPFQASKKDVRALFGTYGQLRSVRVPQKFDRSARGFAFADFITAREAENALEALKDTHFLGRRLVLEFASEDALDAEEEIEKMQKKVGSQVDKVALQILMGGGRKKFNIEGNDVDEG